LHLHCLSFRSIIDATSTYPYTLSLHDALPICTLSSQAPLGPVDQAVGATRTSQSTTCGDFYRVKVGSGPQSPALSRESAGQRPPRGAVHVCWKRLGDLAVSISSPPGGDSTAVSIPARKGSRQTQVGSNHSWLEAPLHGR